MRGFIELLNVFQKKYFTTFSLKLRTLSDFIHQWKLQSIIEDNLMCYDVSK